MYVPGRPGGAPISGEAPSGDHGYQAVAVAFVLTPNTVLNMTSA
jgi:hypothetical protein